MDSMLCQAGWLEKDANSYRLKELGRDAYSDFGMI
jgi:hypothetical protein